MRIIFTIWAFIALTSCFNTTSSDEIYQQNLRITRLEQRIDSLINGYKTIPVSISSNNKNWNNPTSYSPQKYTNRCQAITRKGTQCKRTARYGSYCWQHGR